MIVVRDIFNLKFGKTRDAMTLWQDGTKFLPQTGASPARLLTDVTGDYYTVVLESTFNSLADYEKAHSQTGQSKEWHEWYQKFTPLVESGRREIFSVVK
jgi:hypothetical protein